MQEHIEKKKTSHILKAKGSAKKVSKPNKRTFVIQDNRANRPVQRQMVPSMDTAQPRADVSGSETSIGGVKVTQLRKNTLVLPSAQKHYSDGWGARYGITSDAGVKSEILTTDTGSGGVDFGWYDAPESEQPNPKYGRRKEKHCEIKYRDASEKDTTAVYHCGPSGEANWYSV